ncbi:MAG: hypothetical protein M9921_12880 [Fimbriimonadaceae bacterium]|nr:hypothetical protein [Fimbriimonadaceae bacterium]
MIDAETGEVELVLVPFHLKRLHGPLVGDLEGTGGPAGLPFPLLPNADPIVLRLRPGMTPDEIAMVSPFEPNSSLGNESWWRWHAYAWTPFGWSPWPTPHFYGGHLGYLGLDGSDGPTAHSRMRAMLDYGEREFGEPGEGLRVGWFRSRKARPGETPGAYVWKREWGSVVIGLEPRDHQPVLGVKWNRVR